MLPPGYFVVLHSNKIAPPNSSALLVFFLLVFFKTDNILFTQMKIFFHTTSVTQFCLNQKGTFGGSGSLLFIDIKILSFPHNKSSDQITAKITRILLNIIPKYVKYHFRDFSFQNFSGEGYIWTTSHMAHASPALKSLMSPSVDSLKYPLVSKDLWLIRLIVFMVESKLCETNSVKVRL